jgi:16S rRNA (guanine527-N7)-methyltransferase
MSRRSTIGTVLPAQAGTTCVSAPVGGCGIDAAPGLGLAPVGPVPADAAGVGVALVDAVPVGPGPAAGVPPENAAAVFGPDSGPGSVLFLVGRYAEILATRGVEQGLIGPREAARLWDRHLLNCAVVAELIDATCGTLVDIGSGAGLPGLVLAMMRPEIHVTLLEPMERRTRFLSECVAELALANVTVLRGRAEDAAIRADVATARAVAPLGRLAELAIRVVRPGGTVLAIKGRTASDELTAAAPILRRIGARSAEVVRAGQGKVIPATTVVRFIAR